MLTQAVASQPPQGSYITHLQVTDSTGGTAAAQKAFKVGVPSATPPPAGGTPTLAVIDSPGQTVSVAAPPRGAGKQGAAAAGGGARVVLDASNSAAAAGSAIKSYAWGVVSLPERRAVVSAEGQLAEVTLEPGSYQVRGCARFSTAEGG